MEFFVHKNSIVRRIWGRSDTILFIFAGAAAEFALNKAVDWLYFTGRLPADPIGRLFSTVSYARQIVFSENSEALRAIEKINHIHSAVEKGRAQKIPDWAYRDVLYMLMHYSIASFELLDRKMTDEEKADLYDVFYRMGLQMGLKELPPDYVSWLPSREKHMQEDLAHSPYTEDLFRQYKRALGGFRYRILVQAQILVIPAHVRRLLHFSSFSWLLPAVPVYRFARRVKMEGLIQSILLPPAYKKQIKALDIVS
jgi:hypothetical protein